MDPVNGQLRQLSIQANEGAVQGTGVGSALARTAAAFQQQNTQPTFGATATLPQLQPLFLGTPFLPGQGQVSFASSSQHGPASTRGTSGALRPIHPHTSFVVVKHEPVVHTPATTTAALDHLTPFVQAIQQLCGLLQIIQNGLASAAAITAIAPSLSSSPTTRTTTAAAVENLTCLAKDTVALCLLYFLECDQKSPRAGRAAATARVRAREALEELEWTVRNMLVEVMMVDPAHAENASKCQEVARVLAQLKSELARMFGL
ncbi:hypothetical protein BGZ82_002826 [Podila clonocystis]|nr:hypothetical protein BGZ82_002826 [Podila clonocystis]